MSSAGELICTLRAIAHQFALVIRHAARPSTPTASPLSTGAGLRQPIKLNISIMSFRMRLETGSSQSQPAAHQREHHDIPGRPSAHPGREIDPMQAAEKPAMPARGGVGALQERADLRPVAEGEQRRIDLPRYDACPISVTGRLTVTFWPSRNSVSLIG